MSLVDADAPKRPTIDAQRAFYDERWDHHEYAGRRQLERATEILRGLHRLNIRRPRILELGCGTGWLTSILARFGPAAGVDLSPAAISKAARLYPDVEFRVVDLSSVTHLDPVDVVVSHEVIEHVEDQPAHVSLAARSLRPGGFLILTTPNGRFRSRWPGHAEVGAQPLERWLTRRQLHALLAHEFAVLECRSIVAPWGGHGVLWGLSSTRLTRTLKQTGLLAWYRRAVIRAGYGRHLYVVARRL